MIVTVTANPSIDYLVDVPQFEIGKTNRTCFENALAGGKGINVSLALNKLGIESEAMGFSAGFTGAQILSSLDNLDISHKFVHLTSQFNRINVKLINYEGTEINGQGPIVPSESVDLLTDLIVSEFEESNQDNNTSNKQNDILVLSGSVPRLEGYDSQDFYAMILKKISEKNQQTKNPPAKEIKCICDTTGKTLLNTLKYHPWLIKPNVDELAELCGHSFNSLKDVAAGAKELQEMGARNVLVSSGLFGGILASENGEVLHVPAPSGKLVNAVGAGDSMVAGWIYGASRFENFSDVLRVAVAAGSASAFSESFAEKCQIDRLFSKCACASRIN